MNLKPLLLLLLVFALIPSAAAAVDTLTATPENPEQGDLMDIYIHANPDEELPIIITLERDLDVTSGRYILDIQNLVIPDPPNHFSIRSSPVKTLTVTLSGFSLTKGTNDVAILSASNIRGGTYDTRIQGRPKTGVYTVAVTITAESTITTDSNGEFHYYFADIPAGDYTIDVDGHTLSVTVSPPTSTPPSGGSSGRPPVIIPPTPRVPEADASHPESSVTGTPVTFDASPSIDPDHIIVSYTWNIAGDDYSGIQVTKSFDEPGLISVSLTVLDTLGRSSTYTGTVNIADVSLFIPIADAGSSRNGFTGQTITFDAGASISPNSEIIQYRWYFGDESIGQGVQTTHSYRAPGKYSVELAVTNDRGVVATDSIIIQIDELPGTTFQDETLVNESRNTLLYPEIGVTVELNATGEVYLLVFRYEEGSFKEESLPEKRLYDILDLSVSDSDAVEWPLYVEFTYNVTSLDESRLGLFVYLNGTWSECSATGVDLERKVVWAYLTRNEVSGSPVTVAEIRRPANFILGQITVTPSEPEIGEEVTISIPYFNSGDLFGEAFIVITVDDGSELTVSLALEGNSETVYTYTTSFHDVGVHFVQVLGEDVLVNVMPHPADLVPVSILVIDDPIYSNEKFSVNLSLKNDGDSEAIRFDIQVTINNTVIEQMTFNNLQPNETSILEFNNILYESGRYTLTYIIDSMNDVNEINEENNVITATILVEEKPSNERIILLSLMAVAIILAIFIRNKSDPFLGSKKLD